MKSFERNFNKTHSKGDFSLHTSSLSESLSHPAPQNLTPTTTQLLSPPVPAAVPNPSPSQPIHDPAPDTTTPSIQLILPATATLPTQPISHTIY